MMVVPSTIFMTSDLELPQVVSETDLEQPQAASERSRAVDDFLRTEHLCRTTSSTTNAAIASALPAYDGD